MLGLYLRTARHYLPLQLIHRIRYNIESQVTRRVPQINKWRYAVPAAEAPSRIRLFPEHATEFLHDERALQDSAERLARGEFTLLNSNRALGFPVQWNPQSTTRLWRYNLHYFDYVLDLGILVKWRSNERAGDTLRKLIGDWIESNPVGTGVGWHSYPLSRRIVNWLQAASLAAGTMDRDGNGFRKTWTRSLFQQTRYLEDHLEVDLSGNHLLANAKALFFAGVLWGGNIGERWREKGIGLLWQGLNEQVLEDGGQYERSPMYQTIVLQDYLEVIHLLQVEGRQFPSWARDRLILMADFLFSMLHPDGEISLFADSAFGIAYKPLDVLAAAEHLLDVPGRWNGAIPGPFCGLVHAPIRTIASNASSSFGPSSLPATGYFDLFNGERTDKLIVDGRPMAPDHLPAHGHCSLFSFELSVAGERFVVDSGVQEYESGPWRDFWRSTRAHNTVSVDGAEQSEIWASFRVGERTRLLGYAYLQKDAAGIFVGLHNGFAGQGQRPTPHRRFIAALPNRRWVVIDEIFGTGTHTIQSFIHFAPGIDCRVEDRFVELRSSSPTFRLYPMVERTEVPIMVKCWRGQTEPVQGWYAPQFGEAYHNAVVELTVTSSLPARFGYMLAPAEQECTSWSFCTKENAESAQVEYAVHSPAGADVVDFTLAPLPSMQNPKAKSF